MPNVSSPPSSREPGPQRRNVGTVLIVVGVVVLVIIGFVAIGLSVGGGSNASSPKPTTPSVTVTSPSPSTSPPTTAPSSLHCSTPPPLPKSPQQWSKPPSESLAQDATWQVTLHTNCGDIEMHLDGKAAPQTVASFLFLSEHHFYDSVPCHRLVTSGIFVLQCGDPTGTGSGGPGYQYQLENAPANGDYPPGTVAMARTTDPNSNGSQYFICYQDTKLPAPGYSIFGTVTKGLDIVQAIAAKGIGPDGTAPAQPISVLSVDVKKL
jgi:peptidyl-prolyl cis-trans isomerase B (cyclophilin B)